MEILGWRWQAEEGYLKGVWVLEVGSGKDNTKVWPRGHDCQLRAAFTTDLYV
jgi:hypothetical protein